MTTPGERHAPSTRWPGFGYLCPLLHCSLSLFAVSVCLLSSLRLSLSVLDSALSAAFLATLFCDFIFVFFLAFSLSYFVSFSFTFKPEGTPQAFTQAKDASGLKYTDLVHKHKPFLDPVKFLISLTFSPQPDFLEEMPALCFISSHLPLHPWLLVPSECSWWGMYDFIAQSSRLFSSLLFGSKQHCWFSCLWNFFLTLSANSTLDFPSTLWADFSFFLFWAFTLMVTITLDCLKVLSPILLSFQRIFCSLLTSYLKTDKYVELILSPWLWALYVNAYGIFICRSRGHLVNAWLNLSFPPSLAKYKTKPVYF